MRLAISIFTVLFTFVVICEADLGMPMNENEMYKCFYVIACDLRKPLEFRRFLDKSGPGLLAAGFKWFGKIFLIPDPKDSPEFWKTFPDVTCKRAEEEKQKMFNEWMTEMAEHYVETCSSWGDKLECQKMEEATNEFLLILSDYTLSGDCQSSMTKKPAELLKNVPGGIPALPVGMPAMKIPGGFGK